MAPQDEKAWADRHEDYAASIMSVGPSTVLRAKIKAVLSRIDLPSNGAKALIPGCGQDHYVPNSVISSDHISSIVCIDFPSVIAKIAPEDRDQFKENINHSPL